MNDTEERRQHPRQPGQGLVVMIGRRLFPIANISLSGLGFQGCGYQQEEVLKVQIARIDALEDRVDVTLTVRAVEDNMVRAEFHPTLPLMSYIVSHFGEVMGVSPTYPAFRRPLPPVEDEEGRPAEEGV